MLRRTGLVTALRNGEAVILVDADDGCSRCARGEGCGFGLVGNGDPSRRSISLPAPGHADLAVGDRVELGLAPVGLVRATFIVYGLPGGALLLSAVASAATELPEGAAISLALVSLLLAFAVSRRLSRTRLTGILCRPRLLGRSGRTIAGHD